MLSLLQRSSGVSVHLVLTFLFSQNKLLSAVAANHLLLEINKLGKQKPDVSSIVSRTPSMFSCVFDYNEITTKQTLQRRELAHGVGNVRLWNLFCRLSLDFR